jgi:hypothetical protein
LNPKHFLAVPDNVIVRLLHPQSSRSSESLVDLVCGEALDGMQYILQLVSRIRSHQGVDVIRHDNEVSGVQPRTVKVGHRVRDDCGNGWIAKMTCSVSLIEKPEELSREVPLEQAAIFPTELPQILSPST